jgi:lipopolysaccharide O-acetyltransferase
MSLFKTYGFWGTIHLLRSLIYTKISFPAARIIRLPFDIRNRRYIKLGKGFTSGRGCRIEAYPGRGTKDPVLVIGANVQINDYVHITAANSVTIGNNVLIASKVYISDVSHGLYKGENSSSPEVAPADRKLVSSSVTIHDNVWIGDGVCVLPGVTIGYGSIIGANAVVNKDVPPESIAVGIPARIVKKYSTETKQWDQIF